MEVPTKIGRLTICGGRVDRYALDASNMSSYS